MIDFPLPFLDPLDCEQSLFFFRFSAGDPGVHARASVELVVICVSRACRRTD